VKKGYRDVQDRIRKDAQFRQTVLTEQINIPALRAFALAVAASLVPGATGTSLVKRGGLPVGAMVPWQDGSGQQQLLSLVVLAIILLCTSCFLTGCLAGACPGWVTRGLSRRCRRAVLAFFWEPIPITPGHRSLGVQSQCTFTHWLSDPRFKAEQNGFRRAGEVGPEVLH
jgi:hypothetical protein